MLVVERTYRWPQYSRVDRPYTWERWSAPAREVFQSSMRTASAALFMAFLLRSDRGRRHPPCLWVEGQAPVRESSARRWRCRQTLPGGPPDGSHQGKLDVSDTAFDIALIMFGELCGQQLWDGIQQRDLPAQQRPSIGPRRRIVKHRPAHIAEGEALVLAVPESQSGRADLNGSSQGQTDGGHAEQREKHPRTDSADGDGDVPGQPKLTSRSAARKGVGPPCGVIPSASWRVGRGAASAGGFSRAAVPGESFCPAVGPQGDRPANAAPGNG